MWKLVQASKIEKKDSFPYFSLLDKQSYAESETKKLDEEAMRYLSYVMYPLMVIYVIYALIYN